MDNICAQCGDDIEDGLYFCSVKCEKAFDEEIAVVLGSVSVTSSDTALDNGLTPD